MQSNKPRSAEMNPGPGFRVRRHVPRLPIELVSAFSAFETPDVSDQLNRLYAVDSSIQCLTDPSHRLCGLACTVKVFPGDNLMVHKALDIALPGDVIVVDGSGMSRNAVLGDLISTKAKHRRIAGFVVDGLIRDLPEIRPLDIPVFARGTTPIGPLHRGPGEVNFPICCGGVVVNPGDIVLADQAGIVIVPREVAVPLLEQLRQHQAKNSVYRADVRAGKFSNDWVDRTLHAGGCLIVPEKDSDDLQSAPGSSAAEPATSSAAVPVILLTNLSPHAAT